MQIATNAASTAGPSDFMIQVRKVDRWEEKHNRNLEQALMQKKDCLSGSHLYICRISAEQKIVARDPHNEDT